MNNKQSDLDPAVALVEVKTPRPPAPGNGGYRPGSGRKPGSTQKLSGQNILDAVLALNNGVPYEMILVNDFLAARAEDDRHLVAKYHQLILNKVIADKVDITSNGQQIAPTIVLDYQEIDDGDN